MYGRRAAQRPGGRYIHRKEAAEDTHRCAGVVSEGDNMKYKFTVIIDTAEELLIGDKERIAQALERVAGVRDVSFPNIEYIQEQIK